MSVVPTPEREKLRTVALAWGGGLGPAGFRRLVEHFGSTLAALEADVAALSTPGLRLTPDQLALIPSLGERLEDFSRELEELAEQSIAVLCAGETDYPQLLLDLRSPPPVVCVAGRLLAQDHNAIAIVGTRTPTEEGFAMARDLAGAFAQAGTTVVSGLARGCDTAAHLGALEGGGRTVAILGSGIRRIHPRENADLARRIAESGAVLSEQAPDAHPTRERLMARNRLQSALSRGVLVVESREQGGALATARQAQEQGRWVYALKWPEPKEEAAGPEALLRQGAEAVTGPGDVPRVRMQLLDHLGRLERRHRARSPQRSLFDPPDEASAT